MRMYIYARYAFYICIVFNLLELNRVSYSMRVSYLMTSAPNHQVVRLARLECASVIIKCVDASGHKMCFI